MLRSINLINASFYKNKMQEFQELKLSLFFSEISTKRKKNLKKAFSIFYLIKTNFKFLLKWQTYIQVI